MKSITDQVDEFIEGLHDGSILYQNIDVDHLRKDQTWITAYNEETKRLAKQYRITLNNSIENYLKGKEKQTMAGRIYTAVLMLRSFGVIQTNVHISKDVQFFKERCKQLEADKQKLEEKVSDLSTKILHMSSPPDPKIGTL